jgi:alkylation response protein AidB-like acyl-CoA dehydrogenase
MPLVDIELGLDETERAIQDTAHKFAEEVLRPAGEELDRLADPSDVSAPGSPLWKVFEKHRELGLADLESEAGDLSPIQRARVRAILNEEFGWGDSGLAISLGAWSSGSAAPTTATSAAGRSPSPTTEAIRSRSASRTSEAQSCGRIAPQHWTATST